MVFAREPKMFTHTSTVEVRQRNFNGDLFDSGNIHFPTYEVVSAFVAGRLRKGKEGNDVGKNRKDESRDRSGWGRSRRHPFLCILVQDNGVFDWSQNSAKCRINTDRFIPVGFLLSRIFSDYCPAFVTKQPCLRHAEMNNSLVSRVLSARDV